MATSFAGGRAGRRGPGRGRDDAGRQRLRARARGVRGRSGARRSRRSGRCSSRGSRHTDRHDYSPPDAVTRAAASTRAADPRATAMLVRDGRIAWLGADADAPAADVTVDLGGALVTPAFVDAHLHATDTGLAFDGLDLSGGAFGRASCWTRWRRSRRPGRPAAWCTGTAGTSRRGRSRRRRRPRSWSGPPVAAGSICRRRRCTRRCAPSSLLPGRRGGGRATTSPAGCGSRPTTRYGRWRSAR